jgi:hypothetical protein
MIYRIALTTLVILFSIACSNRTKNYDDIQLMFDTLALKIKDGYRDTAYLNKTLNEVKSFAQKHPKDSLAAKILFQAAQQLEAHNLPEKAVQILENIQKNYSETAYAAKALLTEGFIYNNVLNDAEQAKAKYNEYLSKYRDLDKNLTRDVELELKNIGKSADELIKEFEAKLKEADNMQAN